MSNLLPYDVNDAEIREGFLKIRLIALLNGLKEQTMPLWGKMSARHMIEHLIWTFEISKGEILVNIIFPEANYEEIKKFLYDDRFSPRLFKNPMLGNEPPELKYDSLRISKKVLNHKLTGFYDYYNLNPEVKNNHPVFGPLNREECERTNYKHCYHHLMQFGLIE